MIKLRSYWLAIEEDNSSLISIRCNDAFFPFVVSAPPASDNPSNIPLVFTSYFTNPAAPPAFAPVIALFTIARGSQDFSFAVCVKLHNRNLVQKATATHRFRRPSFVERRLTAFAATSV